MKVLVRLRGVMGSQCNWDEREYSLESGATIATLKNSIETENSGISFESLRANAIVNNEFVTDDTLLNHGDEVSFLPPLAGG